MVDLGFLSGGSSTPKALAPTYYLINISKNLYVNEEILAQREGLHPLRSPPPPPDPPPITPRQLINVLSISCVLGATSLKTRFEHVKLSINIGPCLKQVNYTVIKMCILQALIVVSFNSGVNKKVLLRERKRHTACRVASTWCVDPVGGYPPFRTWDGGTQGIQAWGLVHFLDR